MPYRAIHMDLDRDLDLPVILVPIRLRPHTGTSAQLPLSALLVGKGLAAIEGELVEMRVSDRGLRVRPITSARDLGG